MSFYGFEYFSGANVVIKTNGHACLEAAAFSYNEIDSKRPVYGYCSTYYDAVAPGQRIIQGSIVVNYVYDNYLFDCIKKGMGLSPQPSETAPATAPNSLDAIVNDLYTSPNGITGGATTEVGFDGEPQEALNSQQVDYSRLEQNISALQQQFWQGGSNEDIANYGNAGTRTIYGDPMSLGGGIQISVNFGNSGEAITIDGVNFVGRGSAIQIDENAIVEEYSFFARRLRGSLTTPY